MSQPDLGKQFQRLWQQTSSVVQRLEPSDPMKVWFEVELSTLENEEGQSLEHTNAALSACRQLQHLLFEHCVKLQNANQTVDLGGSLPVSYLSQQAKIPANVLEMAKRKKFSIDPALLFAKDWDNDQFDPVSPTAKIVGYLRSRDSSLRIAPQLLMDEEGKQLLNELSTIDSKTEQLMATLFQARYHTINSAIARSQVTQVVELASGVSPRGIQWARGMTDSIFVETDLPALMIHKAKLLRNHILASDELNRGILHCTSADVLDLSSLQNSLTSIDTDTDFTIVSEGLLLYLTAEELDRFLDHISSILREYPKASWITDFVSRTNLEELLDSYPGVADAVRKVFAMTGRKVVVKNSFVTDQCIEDKLAQKNLSIKQLDRLVDTQKVHSPDSPAETSRMLGSRKIWTLAKG